MNVKYGVYSHRFRHTAVIRLLQARVPIRSSQLFAGRTDPHTTLGYGMAIDVNVAIEAIEKN